MRFHTKMLVILSVLNCSILSMGYLMPVGVRFIPLIGASIITLLVLNMMWISEGVEK